MTYAGLKSMIYAGVSPDDPRVKAAHEWIRKNYTLEQNPGMGDAGLYYYYHTFAKALSALEEQETAANMLLRQPVLAGPPRPSNDLCIWIKLDIQGTIQAGVCIQPDEAIVWRLSKFFKIVPHFGYPPGFHQSDFGPVSLTSFSVLFQVERNGQAPVALA